MKAKFQKIIFERDSFSICSMATDEAIPNEALSPYGTFVAAGYNIPKNEDVELELDGEWVKSKYGLQFGVKACIPTLPETEEGIIAFLSSGALPYIKNKTAVKMYSMYGNDIFRIIKEEPEKLLAFRGINKKRLTAITDAFVVNYGYGELVMFLSPFGVSINKIRKIVDTYGAKATEIVKTNPYNLFRVKGFGFQTVDQIAQKVHTPLNDPLRIEGAIEYVLSEQQSKGNLCMEQTKLLVDAYGFLNGEEPGEVVSKREIIDVIKDLALNGRLCGDNGYAYLPHNYKNEVFAAEKVSALLAQKGNTIGVRVEKEITKFESENFKLAVNQSAAIRQFFDNNFSIVTGGPGTGKSTVLKAILTIQNRLFPDSDVLLCAPTGRAARRMSEATEHSASTIHSAFCIREGTKVDDMEKTAADVVIIDEVSMCDQKLFSLVLAAIDPRRTKLLLVGDSDQLPSVGAGNVLDELISCGKVPYTRLNTNCMLVYVWEYVKPMLDTPSETEESSDESNEQSSSGNGQPENESSNGSSDSEKNKQSGNGKSQSGEQNSNGNSDFKGNMQSGSGDGQSEEQKSGNTAEDIEKKFLDELSSQSQMPTGRNSTPVAVNSPGKNFSETEEAAESSLKKLESELATEKVENKLENDLSKELKLQAKNEGTVKYKVNVHRQKTVSDSQKIRYNILMKELTPVSKALQKRMLTVLKDRKKSATERGLYMGTRLDSTAYARTDLKVFTKRNRPNDELSLAVALLIDESGSMCGEKIKRARQTALIVYDFCSALDIPVAIYGHSTSGYQDDVDMYAYADYDSVDGNDKYRLTEISDRGCNRDGAAIRFVIKRLEKRSETKRLFIIISDGQPYAEGGYYGKTAFDDLHAVKKEYERKGIIFFTAAIDSDKEAIKRCYGERSFLDLSDLNKLPLAITKLIAKHI